MEETIEIMRLLWTGKPASYRGTHFQFEDIAIAPAPHRAGGPPIWLGSQIDPSWVKPPVSDPRLERVFDRVGRLADAWAPLVYSIPKRESIDSARLRSAWDQVQRAAAKAGRPGAVELAFSHWYYIVQTREDEAAARRDVGAFFPGTWDEARNTYLIGTPGEIRDKIRHITRDVAPVGWYIFTALGPDVEQVRRLRADVVPLLEKL